MVLSHKSHGQDAAPEFAATLELRRNIKLRCAAENGDMKVIFEEECAKYV